MISTQIFSYKQRIKLLPQFEWMSKPLPLKRQDKICLDGARFGKMSEQLGKLYSLPPSIFHSTVPLSKHVLSGRGGQVWVQNFGGGPEINLSLRECAKKFCPTLYRLVMNDDAMVEA